MKFKFLYCSLMVAFSANIAWADETRENRHDVEIAAEQAKTSKHEVDISSNKVKLNGVAAKVDANTAAIAANKNAISNIQLTPGPQGPAGPAGADGAVGPMGPQGPAGVAGADGAVGPMGPQGPAGVAGADGAVGPMGPQGPAGVAGADGAVGPMGPQGPAGVAGADGAVGPMGPQGPAGVAGADGAVGPMGPQGPAGAVGPMGPQGPAGTGGVTLVDAAGTNMGQIFGFEAGYYHVVYNGRVVHVRSSDGYAFTPYTGAIVGTITHIMYTGSNCTGTAYVYTGNTITAGMHAELQGYAGTVASTVPVYDVPARTNQHPAFASLNYLGDYSQCTNPVWNVGANFYNVIPLAALGAPVNVDTTYVVPRMPIGPSLR